MALIENIGSVILNLDYYSGKDLYCDGEVEDELLNIVQTTTREQYNSIIQEKCKWPIFYHLSNLRCNCIEWIDIDKNSEILEVGSGCGAITTVLSDKCKHLTCVELSKKRSSINAWRNKDKENIEIYVGNFQDIADKLDKKFDIVTLIGVLEYGQLYINTKEPYTDFLKKIKSMLKPNGKIIIAIENKLGMKYWAGSLEDHIGRYYESIENYPSNTGIRTFTKTELSKMLNISGFNKQEFFYPYPDYKFATTIYSDDYLPKAGELNNNLRNFDNERIIAFDEKKAFDNIIENGLFAQFSNSYLVIAGGDL